MRNIALDGAIVPSLWHLEVANALHIAMRRKRCDEDYVDRSLERLTRLPIAVDYQTSDRAWGATKTVARGTYPKFVRCCVFGTRVAAQKAAGILRCGPAEGGKGPWCENIVGLRL